MIFIRGISRLQHSTPESGEIVERRLSHEGDEAEKFYASLPGGAVVGMEATLPAQWFERTLQIRNSGASFNAWPSVADAKWPSWP